jgi:hypothetical protein
MQAAELCRRDAHDADALRVVIRSMSNHAPRIGVVKFCLPSLPLSTFVSVTA